MALTITVKEPELILKSWHNIMLSEERQHFVTRIFNCLKHSESKELCDRQTKDVVQMEYDAYVNADSRAEYYFKITTYCYDLLKASDEPCDPDEAVAEEHLLQVASEGLDKVKIED